MRGTVTKKKDRWYICYYIGKDANGKWKQKWEGSWKSKKEAERVLRKRISEIEESFGRKVEEATLKAYLENWLQTSCQQRLAPNTIRGYKVNIEKHIVPYIGNIRLNRLQPLDIQNLYTQLLGKGLSNTSVRYVHNNLHRALSVAVRQQLIAKNPADYVEIPTVKRYEAAVLNEEQVRQLLIACRNTDIYTPVLLAAMLGLRRGEILGLQWSDFNWEHQTVTIKRSASYVNGGFVLGDTKSKNSRRTLLLSDNLINELRNVERQQKEKCALFGAGFNQLGLVCCRLDGEPISTNVLQHTFSNKLKECGLPHIRFHDLRHTNATLMLQYAVPAKIVSSMLGHSSIGITLDTYSHVLTEMQKPAVGVMDSILKE